MVSHSKLKPSHGDRGRKYYEQLPMALSINLSKDKVFFTVWKTSHGSNLFVSR